MKEQLHLSMHIPIITVTLLLAAFLFSKKVRTSAYWNATATPLASIIGSGFLVLAPLLWNLCGKEAVWILLCVVLCAYAVGSVIRFNILYTEPLVENIQAGDKALKWFSDASLLTLGAAYCISVAFYIGILSSFLLNLIKVEGSLHKKLLACFILLCIGTVGFFRGFKTLEKLEVISVNLKLSIIALIIMAFALYDATILNFNMSSIPPKFDFSFLTFRKIFGILLIVQGFEISRYLGHTYSPNLRIKTMKLSQIISSIIYLLFIVLSMFLMTENQKISETTIIDISRNISFLLPVFLTLGAACSQFSAAIADTIGCGGICAEYLQKISRNAIYLIVCFIGILLILLANIYEIVTYASQLFAAYYITQCLQALYVNKKYKFKGSIWSLFFIIIGFLMLLIFIFALPAG